MAEQPPRTLDAYRRHARLSHRELWLRYFALGGMSSAFELEACLHNALQTGAHEHDVIAHALNERFTELGDNHPVAYSDGKDQTDDNRG